MQTTVGDVYKIWHSTERMAALNVVNVTPFERENSEGE